MGDPAGIGPELILRCAPLISRIKSCHIYGSARVLEKTAWDLCLKREFCRISSIIKDCTRYRDFKYGAPSVTTGRIALDAIDHALKSNNDIIITPPIVKSVIQKRIPDFIGHTEYFAHYFHVTDYAMMGLHRATRIMLMTTHVPIQEVACHIQPALITRRLKLLHWGLRKYFNITEPCIGVSAFNPHGIEFSKGEDEKILKGIKHARQESIDAHGPFPADTLYNRSYNGYLAMFHDQAMIYLKSKKNGLNFTLGLPIIRLSALYGAALDIAGKGIAETSGLETAIKKSILLFNNARRYEKSKSSH